MANLLRKPQSRVQGLKFMFYGEPGAGKSILGLSFPDVAVLDSESKLGVYENDPEYGKNIVAVADTSNYYDTLDVIDEVIKNNLCKTLIIDSETYIYEGMQVACMELEEKRAEKKGGNVDDQTISMRGYGKIKLNSNRLRLLKAQASAKGITIISTAHKEDIMQKVGSDNVKVGEKPALRKNSEHDYDVILRLYKKKDLATGVMKYYAEVEKDTTRTLKIGQVVENPSYELFREYIEKNSGLKTVKTNYDKAIEKDMDAMAEETQNFDDLVKEFTDLFKKLKEANPSNTSMVSQMLKDKGIASYKDPACFEKLKEVVAKLKEM